MSQENPVNSMMAITLNAVVRKAMQLIKRDDKVLEDLANNTLINRTLTPEDDYMIRGCLFSMLVIAKGKMVKYFPEDGNAAFPVEFEQKQKTKRWVLKNQDFLADIIRKVEGTPVGSQPDLTKRERDAISAMLAAIMLLVQEGDLDDE